jgi:hypothetical protein
MRVVWKDSKPKSYKPVKYRGQYIKGSPQGWETDIPGDNNLYKSHYCALNAIDKALGGYGQKGCQKRQACGIVIVGKKDGETA